jgi:hypothetical protein
MKYKISRIEKNIKMDTAPAITGYDDVSEGDSPGEVFNDYRNYHADEGGFSWDLYASDDDGNEYYDRGEEAEVSKDFFKTHLLEYNQMLGQIDETTVIDEPDIDGAQIIRENETTYLSMKSIRFAANPITGAIWTEMDNPEYDEQMSGEDWENFPYWESEPQFIA